MGWIEPHWETSALIVIDMQNEFLADGLAPVPGTSEIVGTVAELVRGFRDVNRPVVHLVRLYEPGSSDVDPVRKAAILSGQQLVAPGTRGSEIADGILGAATATLDPATLLAGHPQYLGASEAVLYKPRWGAFYRTGLQGLLREWQVDTLVVAGCNLPNCPRATLFEASERDFRSVLVTDAVSRATTERVDDLEAIGVQTFSSEWVLRCLPD